MLRRKR